MNEIVTIRAHGHKYQIVNPGGHIGKPIAQGIPYERKLLEYVHRLKLKGSALDIGAHVGNHALWFAAVCGLTVRAFEPQAESYERLAANVALNPYLPIWPYQFALGAADGRASVDHKMTIVDGDDFFVVRGDDVAVDRDLVLIKIDVEGYEPHVMDGLADTIARNKPIVLSESHSDTAEKEQAEVMEPLGYAVETHIHMGSRMAVWKPR